MIPVTKPFMPPLQEYQRYLEGIWRRESLTNNGPLVQQLENQLQKYLGLKHLSYVSNGTIALQIAIKALGLRGEIITTPFSYVATTSSIVWEGCVPIFVDIDPNTLNINPYLIEDAITEKTTAILATHVFGNPCDIMVIQEIADYYQLKVIYDAAHCFGTMYKGESIYHHGDVCTTSFHTTKVFHTVEGGAIITKDPEISQKVDSMRNFGHTGTGSFEGIGTNGKNSEFHAAMGLCNLNYIDDILRRRKGQWLKYNALIEGSGVKSIVINKSAKFNYAYYPVIFENEQITLRVKEALERAGIFPRRYFYPALTNLNYVKSDSALIAESIARRILCLPLYHTLREREQELLAKILLRTLEPVKELNG